MGLKIRLARAGAKKRPYYHIVIADSRSPRDGRFIEKVGSYNPMLPSDHAERIRLQEDRLKHWIGNGAVATERVARFLGRAGLIAMPAIPAQTKQAAPRRRRRNAPLRRRLAELSQRQHGTWAASALWWGSSAGHMACAGFCAYVPSPLIRPPSPPMARSPMRLARANSA